MTASEPCRTSLSQKLIRFEKCAWVGDTLQADHNVCLRVKLRFVTTVHHGRHTLATEFSFVIAEIALSCVRTEIFIILEKYLNGNFFLLELPPFLFLKVQKRSGTNVGVHHSDPDCSDLEEFCKFFVESNPKIPNLRYFRHSWSSPSKCLFLNCL